MLGLVPIIPFAILFIKSDNRSKFGSDQSTFLLSLTRNAFGILWIIDGILQIQPGMGSHFIEYILEPNAAYGGITSIVTEKMIGIWSINPEGIDIFSSLIQIYIGFITIFASSKKILALTQIVTILWATMIWVFGEGFGGLFIPGYSILSGFPGSALIYVLAAAEILLLVTGSDIKHVYKFFVISDAAIIFGALLLEILPAGSLFNSIPQCFMPSPFWFLNFANNIQVLLVRFSFISSLVLTLLLVISLYGILMDFRPAFLVAAAISFFSWIFFQGLGMFSAMSTDPNTGLPLVILNLTLFYMKSPSIMSINSNTTANKIAADSVY